MKYGRNFGRGWMIRQVAFEPFSQHYRTMGHAWTASLRNVPKGF